MVKVYPNGPMSEHLHSMNVDQRLEFKGPLPKYPWEANKHQHICLIAGGTGITPMYQLIRAICEDDRDTTEISLIYANRSEGDILLREELERFARQYPKNFKLWYMLDTAPEDWPYGTGYVDRRVLSERLPGPSEDTKIMLCGPPGMINACKKTLAGMGFKAPGAVSKMSDQIFCF